MKEYLYVVDIVAQPNDIYKIEIVEEHKSFTPSQILEPMGFDPENCSFFWIDGEPEIIELTSKDKI